VHVQVHEADLFQDSQGDPPSAIARRGRPAFFWLGENPRRDCVTTITLQSEAAPN
jgi:hypothetical protein